MTKQQKNDILTYLDGIDYSVREIEGALASIMEKRKWIIELLNLDGIDLTQPH